MAESMFRVTNLTPDAIRVTWDSMEYQIPGGGACVLPDGVATHFCNYYPPKDGPRVALEPVTASYEPRPDPAPLTDPRTGLSYASPAALLAALAVEAAARSEEKPVASEAKPVRSEWTGDPAPPLKPTPTATGRR